MLDELRRRHSGADWTAVTIGMSGAEVYRLDDGNDVRYLKIAPRVAGLEEEARRTRWLAARGIPVPEVLDQGGDAGHTWLLTRAVPGRSAAEPWPADRRAAVVDAVADVARTLHALPAGSCPFDESVAATLAAMRRAIDRGPGRSEREAELAELTARAPATEDLVVCHGDYCLPNVLLDPDTLRVTGLVDLGRVGRADRHADLALMTRSLSGPLNPQYGPAYAERFLARYLGDGRGGASADEARLAFYRRLDDFF
ncbi:APH(3') family aminoglycoside O-phosphotransferase [Streptomyces litchfieldiae]|uniref:APH(3') family aminoglycoside O-phosphotransferase n=1 Tax=Streptomyces litchfieldiae TaxID=3075543 RepID=A0ABU2MZG0_9ACTN|nr:APH(3') family aminoglycoside O-phosphotransferase [Streptomyces sp. DSM 44938]MDT0345894.1 APH(3') family aminoglycoside O-phosphotransferase [Streptomyces sp. DSM 44938]